MKKYLWISILLVPLAATGWAIFVSWAADISVSMVSARYVNLSENELASLDRVALAKLASNAIEQSKDIDATWRDVKETYETIVWVLVAILFVITSALVMAALKRPPNSALNPDAQKRRAG